jgi:glycosyltransferase involved in cell wall biosynthesis
VSGTEVPVAGHGALVDGRVITHPTAGGRGVGRYTVGFVRAMSTAGLEPVVLHTDDAQRDLWTASVPGIRTAPLHPTTVREAARDRRWFVCTQLMLHPVPLDVIPRAVTEARLPVAAIIHDVIPQRFPERYLADPHAAVQTALRTLLCRGVDRFCANSTFTAETAAVELGVERSRFHVVGAAVEPQFTPGAADALLLERLGATCPAGPVVAVTGADGRKNTERLIAAWARVPGGLRARHRLVIACAAPRDVLDHWNHLALTAGVGDTVVLTGSISDDEMVGLLRSATLSVLPSIEEGFGLPIVESVACGTPALCSRTSSMPEVSGSTDAEFDPFDIEDIAGAIVAALVDPVRRDRILEEQRERSRRWSVGAVGAQIAAALAGPGSTGPGSVPERVIVAAPHPSSPSGIGPYTARVLAHWPDPAELVVLDETAATDRPARTAGAGTPVAGVSALGRTLREHDADHVIAVVGSSAHHAVTLDRATRWRCHLWLHEPTAVGAVLGPAHLGGTPRWVRERVLDLGLTGVESFLDDSSGEIPDAGVLHAAGQTLLETVAGRSRSIIVSSDIAARELRRTCDGVALPPILVLPLGHPPSVEPHHDGTRRDETPGGRVISLGWIDPGKDPDSLLDMVARLEDVSLDLVGGGAEAELDRLRIRAARLGIGPRVRIHGRVPDAERDALIAAADVAVQLRVGHTGQMSAAVTELLAAGVPVITTLHTHGPSGDGLRVLDGGPDLPGRLLSEVRDLLADPVVLQRHRSGALARSARWGVGDVARSLRQWIATSDRLHPGTVIDVSELGDLR